MRFLMKTAAAAIALVSIAGTAEAAPYLVTYTAAGTSFSGTITTSNTANSAGFFTVTGITGTRNGLAVTLLAPGAFPVGSDSNDNLFKPTSAFFTFNGLSYSVGGTLYNIYTLGTGLAECISTVATTCNQGNANAVTKFTVTALAVPEPATWGMLILGFGVAGGALRARRKTVAVSFA